MKLRTVGLLICLSGLAANTALAKGITCLPKKSNEQSVQSIPSNQQQKKPATNKETSQ